MLFFTPEKQYRQTYQGFFDKKVTEPELNSNKKVA